jgi:methionine synthase / methylenetetrahydrofolate reductase(NADPH)
MNARTALRDRLEGSSLLLDGAMGTLLFSRGIPQRACLDELATTRPELIGAIHREYVDAGADLIETATFGANSIRLATWGLAPEAARFNRRAAQVAREARDVAGRAVLVAGSIGPIGAPTRELLRLPEASIRAAYRPQIEGLLEGGVDLFILETFVDLGQLVIVIDEVRRASADLPLVAQFTFGEDLVLADGTDPGAAARALLGSHVDVIGVNCGVGPQGCLEALEAMAAATEQAGGRANADAVDSERRALSLSILPNAGLPQRVEGQFVYAADPAYFGRMIPAYLDAGAAIVGGCCGTTPAHVAAMRTALDGVAARGAAGATEATSAPSIVRQPRRSPVPPPAERAPSPRATTVEPAFADSAAGVETPPTRLATALASNRFIVSVEIDPPRSVRIERTIEAARLLQGAGVDVVNVSDSAMARVRMGALAVAFGIQHDIDLECIVHLTTRDRNLMAIESELLGAHALGVRNVVALTGDPPRVGDYPTGTGVWDVDSIGLIEILTRLNRGEDQAGSPIGQHARFTIACALNPTAPDGAREWERLERKLEAGAHLIMTQPLYDLDQVEAMAAEAHRRFGAAGFPVPVLLGVLPLQSARHAEFLHNEVPGITVPEAARTAMHAAGDRAAEVGLEMTVELLASVGSLVRGTYIMPSFGRYEQAAELVRRIRARHSAAAGAGVEN